MSSTKSPGRFAGLLYLLTSIVGVFAVIYVPGKLIVDGNAAATANNIVQSQGHEDKNGLADEPVTSGWPVIRT